MTAADLLDQFGATTARELRRAYDNNDRAAIKRLRKEGQKYARKLSRATGQRVEFFAL